MRTLIFLFIQLTLVTFGQAQLNFWSDAHERSIILPDHAQQQIIPQRFRTLELDLIPLQRALQGAQEEITLSSSSSQVTVQMPLPEGGYINLEIYASPIMEPGLAQKYPTIKTFLCRSENGRVTGRLDYGAQGFHGILYTPEGTVYIDPFASGQSRYYMAYYKKDHLLSSQEQATYRCAVESIEKTEGLTTDNQAFMPRDEIASSRSSSESITLRKYRLALATTGEYANFHSGNGPATKEKTLSAMVTAINRVNSILEREIAVRLLLIDETDKVIHLNSLQDPYNNGDTGAMIDQNVTVLDSAFGSIGFDIGHVFGTNGGGLAQLQSVCSGNKARGVTCHNNPIGDGFYVDYVCHEIGHQFGANHSFNNCSGNENSGTAFEPGSGSTIMSYSGLCGTNNVTFLSGDYYHSYSLEEMIRFSRQGNGNSCGAKTATANTTPTAEIALENGFYIPIQTPFVLTGSGTDPEGDILRYNWEQYDIGPVQQPLGEPVLNSPAFRSIDPSEDPTRFFPAMDKLLANSFDNLEVLPTYARDLTFRFTVRDFNAEGGGVDWKELKFKATDTAGPFIVTAPNNENDLFEVGQYVEIAWEVANTDKSPVNCKQVNILLSIDGGLSYPIELATNTGNDGSEYVLIPDQITTLGRIKIEAADNIFFDISNQNFAITAPSKPGYSLSVTPNSNLACLPNAVNVDILTSSLLAYDQAVSLSVISGLPEGASAVFSANPILPGDQASLSIEMDALVEVGVYEMTLQAVAPNADTSLRRIRLDVVSNDFSAFELQGPMDGSSGLSGLPEFRWKQVDDADSYEIEIATNPAFGDFVVDAASGLKDSLYQPGITLEENSLYYWRLRPANRCGSPAFQAPRAFHTESIDCQNYVSENVPINISATGTPTVESVITVGTEGIVSDLNMPILKGSHDLVKHIDVKLIAPDDTEVLLFSKLCGNTSFFNIGLDDEAPTEIPCPPLDKMTHQPQQALAGFDGLSIRGDWTLQVAVVDNFGEGGSIDNWELEFCSNISLSNPFLVINDTMPVNPGGARRISQDFLLTQDEVNNPWQLAYTLVTLPQSGTLSLDGQVLEVGDQFTQADINSELIRYLHDGSDNPTDQFSFTVIDGEGGWFGTPKFHIVLDASITVGTEPLLDHQAMQLYPNPVQESLTVSLLQPLGEEARMGWYNLQGQLIREEVWEANQMRKVYEVSNLPNGLYFMRLQTRMGLSTKRFVVQR